MKNGQELRKSPILRETPWLGLMPLVYLALAVLAVLWASRSGLYPAGGDTMYHVHRMELVYNSIREGIWWPAFDKTWYNGVEILRYWPPVAPYFMAACQWAAGGDPFDGYLIFVGVICFLSAFPWLYIGVKMKRPALGAFLGAMWFFVPNNLFALFGEGNLPRAVSMLFIPLYLYHVMGYLWTRRWKHLVGTAVFFAFTAMCHVGYAGMVALATILYLIIYAMANRGSWHSVGFVLGATVLGLGLMGVWVVPSLIGGISNVDSSEAMKGFFQSLYKTLWPLNRREMNTNYFGLSVFVLALLGTFLSKKESAPGFTAGILICLSTESVMYPLFVKLPGGQYLWMLRFISIAICMCLLSLLKWDTLKKPLLLAFCLLFALDSVQSLWLIRGDGNGKTPAERFDPIQQAALVDKAQQITTQRLAMMYEGGDAVDPYIFTTWRNPTDQVFGAGWEAANTAGNIVTLNRSVNEGQYLYLFDRALEFGCDTVLVSLAAVHRPLEAPVWKMDEAAARLGYELVESNDRFRLFHLSGAPEHWGTVSTYHALGIGSRVGMSLYFPDVEEADSSNLSDYTFEQLTQYDAVYIGDFTYDDRAYAEDLIERVSAAGTRVVIVADGIPEDRSTHDQSFLGVLCNPITFSNGFPELDTIDGRINADLFPQDHTNWRTVYMEGLDDVWGYLYDAGLQLDFYGTVKNDNLVFVALNLPYFHDLTHDATVGELLAHAIKLPEDALPDRRIVPLDVVYNGNHITVTSPEDGVNTSLAYHDSFVADQPISMTHHFTQVDKGTTHLTLAYPYLTRGLAVSAVSLVAIIALALSARKREKWETELAAKRAEKEEREEESTQQLAQLAQENRELSVSQEEPSSHDEQETQAARQAWETQIAREVREEEILQEVSQEAQDTNDARETTDGAREKSTKAKPQKTAKVQIRRVHIAGSDAKKGKKRKH